MRRTVSLCLLVAALVPFGAGGFGLWVRVPAGAEVTEIEREFALRLTDAVRVAVRQLVPDSPLAGSDADPVLLFGGLVALGAVLASLAFLIRASAGNPDSAPGAGSARTRKPGTQSRRTRRKAVRLAREIEVEEGAVRAGDFLRAEGLLEESARLFVRREQFERAAEVRHDQNRFEEAAQLYARAGKPAAAAAIYARLGRFEEAARGYRSVGRHSAAAEQFERASRFEQSGECYQAAGLHERAAGVFLQAGLRERASEALVRAFEVALQGSPGQGDAPAPSPQSIGLRAGELLAELGNVAAAERILVRAGALARAGQLALDAGNCDRASEWFLRAGRPDLAADACERGGDTAQAARLRGRHLRGTGDLENASRYLKEAGEYAEAGALYRELGEFEEAGSCYWEAKDYLAAAEMFSAAEVHERAAEAYEHCALFDEAARAFERAGNPDRRADMLERAGKPFEAGRVQADAGKLEESIRLLQRVEAGQPNYVDACLLLGNLFKQQGMGTLSLKKLEQATAAEAVSDENLEAHYLLAEGLREHGSLRQALEVLEKILAFAFHYRDASTQLREVKAEIAKLEAQPGGGSCGPNQAARGGGRYQVIRELGRGGMGVVHLARDSVLDREVALKVLPDGMRGNEKAACSFLREAKAAAQLNHPNIVTIFDAGEDDGFYLAMEYVAGRNMKDLIREHGPCPVDTLLDVLQQMAEALAYAHSRRVVHRDIKTANTMWTPERQVKIMDFGLAKVMQEVRNATTLVSGTPFYMSPEQTQGRALDHRTDLYSLGVTLFELATGVLPFRKGNIAYHHVHTPPPTPRSLRPEVPAELERLILRCVEKDPSQRYSSADELLDAAGRSFSAGAR